MKLTVAALASLASAAYAQSSSASSSAAAATSTGASSAGNSTAYAAGLVSALQAANLTSLATALGAFPNVAQTLASGGNFTVFGPSNEALAPLLADPSSLNLTMIQEVLMYHVAPGTHPNSAFGVGMNHSIIPSALTSSLLSNNKTEPLVISIGMDGQPRVRTATQNVTVYANTTYQNLLIHAVDQVIMTPANLTATVADLNLTQLVNALTAVGGNLTTTLDNTPRLTVFAPSNSAFANISSVISTLNASTIATVLENHIINGTVVYSDMIAANTTAVSAAGETFSFRIDNGTVYVMSGNTTMARIIRTDVPTTNGVVHVIDSVLANTMSDPSAAAAAESSYAAAAASTARAGVGAAGSSDKSGAGFKTVVAGSTVAAAIFGAAVAMLA